MDHSKGLFLIFQRGTKQADPNWKAQRRAKKNGTVSTDHKTGYMQTSTLDLIAILVKGFQEQQERIEALEADIAKIKDENATTSKSAKMTGDIDPSSSDNLANELSQNIPNPFSANTRIPYTVNEAVNNAVIYIFDMNGKLLNNYKLSPGSGELEIQGNSYQPGMYIYSLVCDGKEIDTKRMILTK